MIVWSRSGLVDTMWIGTPVTCSMRCRYSRALTGSLSYCVTPTVLSLQP